MQKSHSYYKLRKTLILEDEKTNKCTIYRSIDIQVYQNIIDFLSIVQTTIPLLKHKNIKIYDFYSNKYISIDQNQGHGKVSANLMNQNHDIVLIKYYQKQRDTQSIFSYESQKYAAKSQNPQRKTERSKERTILQVIHIVKQWRQICQNKRGVSINLSQAAEMIGFPKKSLDDYYYQLRMGEKYGFDFHANIFDRVGKLRSFLRNFKSHRKYQKTQKLPQHLKIVSQIQKYQNIRDKQIVSENVVSKNSQKIEDQNDNLSLQNRVDQDIFQREIGIQNEFYKQFNYNFGNEIDPFISFSERGIYGGFQKIEEENNDNEFNMF